MLKNIYFFFCKIKLFINMKNTMSRKISTVELPEKKKSKQSVDNNVTYRKMMQLKHKLETLSISSKSKVNNFV